MPTTDLYIDTVKGVFVSSPDNGSPKDLPPFVRGTTQNLRIMLLQPTGALAGTIYNKIPVAGQTIQLAIKLNFTSGSYLTDQFSWSAATDLAQPFYSAQVPFNTSNITSAIGNSDFIDCKLQIDRVESGTPIPMILRTIRINNAVIVDGTEVSAPGRTLLYAETAGSMFLTRRIVGSFELVNLTDQTKVNTIFTDTDGTFQAQPET